MKYNIKRTKKKEEKKSKGINKWVKFIIVLALYLAFLVWVESWLGLIVVPFIYDLYITKKIKWTWWKDLDNTVASTIMSWVVAIIFALDAVYFVNNFFSELIETHKVGAVFYLSIASLIIVDRWIKQEIKGEEGKEGKEGKEEVLLEVE